MRLEWSGIEAWCCLGMALDENRMIEWIGRECIDSCSKCWRREVGLHLMYMLLLLLLLVSLTPSLCHHPS